MRFTAPLALAVFLLAPSVVLAQDVACADLPNPVYGLGGSAQKPLLARFGAALAGLSVPITLIYSSPGACHGIYGLTEGERITGTPAYWTADGMERSCTTPPGVGLPTELAVMGNSATLCPGIDALPAGIGDFQGPVGTVNLFVPLASSQQSISAEGLYFVYGFGAAGRAEPWTDETLIIRRDANSFVQQYLALAAGIPAERFLGIDAMNNRMSVTLVATAADPERAIGFASGEVADANRAMVRTLAYQHFGQSCGYWPDSTVDAFDKANVRSGQYHLWGAAHFFAPVDATGRIVDPEVRDVVAWITGAEPAPEGIDALELTIRNGNVPQCAMRARRTTDLGAPVSFVPDAPCGCYFDAIATGDTDCAACGGDSDCPDTSPVCRHGYCEVI